MKQSSATWKLENYKQARCVSWKKGKPCVQMVQTDKVFPLTKWVTILPNAFECLFFCFCPSLNGYMDIDCYAMKVAFCNCYQFCWVVSRAVGVFFSQELFQWWNNIFDSIVWRLGRFKQKKERGLIREVTL